MALFDYTAMTEAGGRVSGALEADSEAMVLRVLEEKHLFPVSVHQKGGVRVGDAPKKRRVRSAELGLLYSQLADLLGSGVPLLRALDSLIKSAPSPNTKALLLEIRAAVAEGKSLTETLRQYPEVFPPLHTAMIQAGERAAFMEEVLRSLAGFIERFEELRSKVMGALIYPALLAALGTVVMLAALMFFVPKFEPLLANVKKPWPSEIMFAASRMVRAHWYLLIIGAGGLGALIWANLKNPALRRRMERWQLLIPVVGSALRLLPLPAFVESSGRC